MVGTLQAVVNALAERRAVARSKAAHGISARFPSRKAVAEAVGELSAALFPVRLGSYSAQGSLTEDAFVVDRLRKAQLLLSAEIERELGYWENESTASFDPDQADTIIEHFLTQLPEIRALLDTDIEAAFLGDPAARSLDEVLICYPGAQAMLHHRLAHALYSLGAPIVARVISELANAQTGIDIHPGATIGAHFFIDHGTGVVIGESTIIGERVRLYQHVTLGARSPLGLTPAGPRERHARHPIVEDDVIIYAGATILGRVTIGRGSVIGGNVWLLDDVPSDSIVAQPAANILPNRDAIALEERLHGRIG